MTAREDNSATQLPHILIEAVKHQRVVIVLGAGASKESKNPSGSTPPNGEQLRDHLAKKFLGIKNEKRDLATISEMAISSAAGAPAVFDEIFSLLEGFKPSKAHQKLTEFRWRGLVTTNYDRLVEEGYASSLDKKQICFPFVKDTEPYDDRLQTVENPVALLKLHGCLNHRLDPDIPLILSNEHYHQFLKNREQLFNRLRQWAQESPLIFVGYQFTDSHLRSLIYDIDPGTRPGWYIVSPNGDDHDRRLWATKNVEVINSTFGEFICALDDQVPKLSQVLKLPEDIINTPYKRHFHSQKSGSELLKNSFQMDLEYVHSGISFDEVSPEKFFSGHDNGWCCIVRNYDFNRNTTEKMIYAALDVAEEHTQELFLLQGAAGSGKTIALRRAAYSIAVQLDEIVVWLRSSGHPKVEVFEELYSLTGKRVLLFVDQISLHVETIAMLLKSLADKSIPITVMASERTADWGSYCEKLEEEYTPKLFNLRRLSKKEAEDLVDLLERYNCLGQLQHKSKADRIAAFMEESQADRQLLVALHELTQGKPFEHIILEEFDKILPETARQLYLDIATLHKFGVVARAGAVSRISGIHFRDFEEKFFAPLQDIVSVVFDPYTGDKGYRTRHTRVSGILFKTACPNDEDKGRQLSRILIGIDIGFSSDKRVLQNICKGRSLLQNFSSIEVGRKIFETAIKMLPSAAFIYQQAAIFEYLHANGSLDKAQKLAETAHEIDSINHIYIHTLAEVARRKAKAVKSEILSAQLRNRSRSYLDKIMGKNSRKDLSFCKLLIDEIEDFLINLSENPKEHELVDFNEKVEKTVERLKRAQQDFPNEAEFPEAEGRLWRKLGEGKKASSTFQKAISKRPKNIGAFTCLSEIQKTAGSQEEAVSTLEKALERFPENKKIHLQMALLKLGIEEVNNNEIESHFRSSFGVGDQYFEARFQYAQFLFWAGKIEDSISLFDEIDKKAPERFRKLAPTTDDMITAKLGSYAGAIESIKNRFFFIRFGHFPKAIFAHMSTLIDSNFEDLQMQTSVSFKLRFNRKGPVAVEVRVQ
ncbi:MAG: SIR2 family protein [Aestuariivita sp.]|nr:SIR2 family protein [Aestuariivita sp.]